MKKNRMKPTSQTTFKRQAAAIGGLTLRSLPLTLMLCASLISAPVAAQEPGLNESRLTFVGADIESVIKAVGHYTGVTFIVDPRVKGTINLVSEQPVTKAQAFELLTSTLRLQGYAVVTANGFTKVVPESDGKLQAGPIQSGSVRGDQIATQVFRLNYENAANMVSVLRPLISPNNSINASIGNNSVVITDYADNLKRLEKIVASLDVPGSAQVDVIPIKYGFASDVATLVTRMTEQNRGPGDSSKIMILADTRTNSILLDAPSQARANLVKNLIHKLDQPSANPGNIHVVYLRNAEALKIAATLRAVVASDGNAGGSGSTGVNGQNQNTSQNQSTLGKGIGGSSGSGSSGSGSGAGLGNALGSAGSQNSANGNANNTLPAGGATGYIQADAATNTLIITASEPVFRNLRSVIDQLDSRRSEVFIEALIVDISSKSLDQLGVQWAAISGNSNSQLRVGTASTFNTVSGQNLFNLAAGGVAGVAASATPPAGLNLGIFSGRLGLGALATALQSDSTTDVLSVPTIMTLDNEEAAILVGQNVPFVTGSFANTGSSNSSVSPFQTVERKDVGVILKVKPQISEGGSVKLNIYQEVSAVDGTTISSTSGITTNVRAVTTNVVVDDGQLLVLGGLMSNENDKNNDQIPLLGDIPYIGNLFKYKTSNKTKRNLLIFLRPTVIRNTDQSNSVSINRYDYMRANVLTANPAQPRLALPSLSPEQNAALIPQDVINRDQNLIRLDRGANQSPTDPMSVRDNTVTPAKVDQ